MFAPQPSSHAASQYNQHYYVQIPDPASHLIHIELHLSNADLSEPFNLKLPVWTPGSYLVREYARHLQDFKVSNQHGDPCRWLKITKNTWQIQPLPSNPTLLMIRYQIYANDLTVRTNHVDQTHAFLNGAATFLYAVQHRHHPATITITTPTPEWHVATSLALYQGDSTSQQWVYTAQHYDEIVDSPIEIGLHQNQTFEVLDKPHAFVVWGRGNLDLAQTVSDTQTIIQTTAQLFDGDLPYDHYLFLLHLSAGGFGGLEHRNSCTLNFSRFEFHQAERYQRFLALVAHEFFHTWNVKRLRPQSLETYDYDQESYLTTLWFCEGATSYYEKVILLRAGLITPEVFLKLISEAITRLQKTPGRHCQSLAESSFDTWIKLYRPHENTSNSQISYYLKGAIVCWLLDLKIRHCSQHQQSLDTVLKDLWQHFGRQEQGYTDTDLQSACERAAGQTLSEFFNSYIYGTEAIDYEAYLLPFGLTLQVKASQIPDLGLYFRGEGPTITTVAQGSPAQRAGIWAGDELLALDGFKVSPTLLLDRLRSYHPTQSIQITVFQQEELKTFEVVLGDPQPEAYHLECVPQPSPNQAKAYHQWLEVSTKSCHPEHSQRL